MQTDIVLCTVKIPEERHPILTVDLTSKLNIADREGLDGHVNQSCQDMSPEFCIVVILLARLGP